MRDLSSRAASPNSLLSAVPVAVPPGTHYDDTASVLYPTAGVKQVCMLPPSALAADDGGSSSRVTPGIPGSTEELPWARASLCLGTALYIPKSYWHVVESTSGSVALSTCVRPAKRVGAVPGPSLVPKRARVSRDT